MKICIPSMGNKGIDEIVNEHFGTAESYTVIDTITGDVKTLRVKREFSEKALSTVDMLLDEGVDVVLCGGLSFGGIGLPALNKLEDLGIKVYVGAIGTVRDALHSFQANTLDRATDVNTCSECNQKQ